MRTVIPFVVLAFLFLPLDAQLWLIEIVRGLWLTTEGRAVCLGVLFACLTAAWWHAAGWDAQAENLYRTASVAPLATSIDRHERRHGTTGMDRAQPRGRASGVNCTQCSAARSCCYLSYKRN